MKIYVTFFIGVLLLLTKLDAKHAPRIIGGTPARAGQFRYAAAIYVQTPNSHHFCGGVLAVSQWVLTSASCVYNATLFTIQLGSTTLTQEDENRLTLASSEYFVHPDYNPLTLEADIGLIKLRMNVSFTDYINQVTFDMNTLQEDEEVLAIGWGQTSDSEAELSEHLQFVEVKGLSNEQCKMYYGNQISENMACVEGNYNEGSCIGDTGSPLLVDCKFCSNEHAMYGIASFVSGNGCESTDPSGYTRTTPYIEWMFNVIYDRNGSK